MDSGQHADVLVIGGGLTGIASALRLAQGGASVVVVDHPLPEAEGRIGGFARFSGAKFSLPPAGMGLLPVAGSNERFDATINSVLKMLKMSRAMKQASHDRNGRGDLLLRSYESILLTPTEVAELLEDLSQRLSQAASLIKGRVTYISPDSEKWTANISTETGDTTITSKAIFYAAGRLSDDLLLDLGAQPVEGKGLDIGVRLEFLDKVALSPLRSLGPDAKILQANCRTFCLNSPGHIYRYPFGGFTIPGGVVASSDVTSGNVGILLRVGAKSKTLATIKHRAAKYEKELLTESNKIYSSNIAFIHPLLCDVFGDEACIKIENFINQLNETELIDLKSPHRVHMPLVDWHWNTFALPCSHRTTLPNVFALGDSSGHARGLLQACMSGWLAAEEYLC